MTMEYASSAGPAYGSPQHEQDGQQSSARSLSFESSSLFRFNSSSDFFAPMKYSEDELTAASSPTGSGDNNDATVPETGTSDVAALSPSNQTTHEEASDTIERPVDIKVRKTETLPPPSRRKSSIEMFLSQSPSQSLGGDFLKLKLDDQERNECAGKSESEPKSAPTATSSSFTSGQFQLNPPKSPREYSALAAKYHPASSSTQESYRRDAGPSAHPSLTRSASMPATSTSNAGYNNAYTFTTREESWPENQMIDTNATYQEQLDEYYRTTQVAASYALEQQQYRHQSHYRAPIQHANVNYNYGASPARMPMMSGQWNPMVVAPPPMYDVGATNMYMNARATPMRQQTRMTYASQQMPMSFRNGSHSTRTPGRPMYSRMMPPLPESTPPQSPRKGMTMTGNMGMKPCKFFLQGHCRMGSKCKFVHQAGVPTPEHLTSGYNATRQPPSLYQPRRMMVSSPSHHLQQRHPMGEDLGQLNGTFGRPNRYRSENSSLNLGLMNTAGGSAPLMTGATDPSSLSTAVNVEDIQNRVFVMSKDQNGCRLLQEQLDYEDRTDLCTVIYRESLEHLAEMMVDPFGNYLFQKLLERVNDQQRLVIIRRVSSNLVAAALNLHGTRSVQKVVEVCATSPDIVTEEYENEEGDRFNYVTDHMDFTEGTPRRMNLPDIIVNALKDDAVRLCIDSNGNHVIQRALQFMKPEYNQFVFDAVCKECTTVGTHRHGCCVLQRCLDAANKVQKAEVIAQVERQAMKLMQDPYGNYVVQYVLDSCTAEEAFGVIMKPLGHIYELSVQKFSSNVIEKCLEKAPERVRQKYIAEITNCPKMNKMLQDQFANYVVQRALCVCAEEQCLLLVKAIRPHLAAMKNTSGGRRITARILKRFPNMDISLEMGLAPGETLFDNGANPMIMNGLSSSMGGYLQEQPLNQMYGMQGGHMGTLFQERENRMPMHEDGSLMMLNEGMGMNATSRA